MIRNESGFSVGWCVGHVAPHPLSATFLVKGTFRLEHGRAAVRSETQRLLSGDIHEADDPSRPLRYASDFSWFKPRADLLLVGTCHAPRSTEVCTAAFQVGSWRKRIVVLGDRSPKRFLFFTWPSDPEPFRALPLSYSRSFGGPDYPPNPCGRRLPNLVDLHSFYIDPESRPLPAGFGPLPQTWPQRSRKWGTFGRAWRSRRFPGLPADCDWTTFNSAPADQQLETCLRGDERVLLENLHPKHRLLETRLPGVRPRWFVRDASQSGEIPLRLDTLWIDADALELVLVWRGVRGIRHRSLREFLDHRIVAERIGDAPAAAVWPAAAAVAAPASRETGPLAGDDRARLQTLWDQHPELAGEIGPPPLPDPWTRERVAEGGDFTGADLSGLDLSGLPLAHSVFRRARLRGCRFDKSDLEGAVFAGADLANATLPEANLATADFAGASLPSAKLGGARLRGADFTGANLSDADLAGVAAEGATFHGADLSRARLAKAVLPGADLGSAKAGKADFRDAALAGASFVGLSARESVFEGADLTGVRARGADLAGAILRTVRAGKSAWEEARLDEADFGGAVLVRANFTGASAARAKFGRADLREARFLDARLDAAMLAGSNLFRSSLEGASLRGTEFSGSNLYEAEFLDAVTDGARFDGAELAGTKLS